MKKGFILFMLFMITAGIYCFIKYNESVCSKHLPADYKIVYNATQNKYAITYKGNYARLTSETDGTSFWWVDNTPPGNTVYSDSCSAKMDAWKCYKELSEEENRKRGW